MSANYLPQIKVDNQDTGFYTLTNKQNVQVTVTNYGARIVSFVVPDKDKNPVEINIGFDSIADYLKSSAPYYGSTIGRFANRIARGKFKLNGEEYTTPVNNGVNTLHGGTGFQDVVWTVVKFDERSIVLTYLSKDGEDGFPGNIQTTLTFTLTDQNELRMDYEAVTDKTTVLNLTNHAYFNLNGTGSGVITDHILQIDADAYLPVDETQIPTGAIDDVSGTPFDFRRPHTIGERINDDNEQLKIGNGYDLNYVLNIAEHGTLINAATITGDKTGITLEVLTTEPGMQFYAGSFMDGSNIISGGFSDDFRTAFALETQHFPDSPNQPSFPSTVLEPGQVHKTSTVYKVSLREPSA